MKIEFDDGGYVNIYKNPEGKVMITLFAIDSNNKLKRIANSVLISLEEFNAIYKEINA